MRLEGLRHRLGSRNVVLSGPLFSVNVVRKQRKLSVRADYVLNSLHLAESHRHQDVQEWSGDLDDSRARLIDQVEIDLVLR